MWEERWTEAGSLLSRIFKPVQTFVARRADFVIVPGYKSQMYFTAMRRGANRIVIAPNASTLEWPSDARMQEFRRLLGIPDKKVILYLGRLVDGKEIDYLLSAFVKLRSEFNDDILLLIVGEGQERTNLELLAKGSLGAGNVKFEGFTDNQAACLSVGDVIVLPTISRSITRSEVWGLVVNEAASLGRPVVVTEAVSCADDLVRRFQCGFVVPEKNSCVLHSAIREILLDPDLAARMGANGIRATKETFNFERMAGAFCDVVSRALASASHAIRSEKPVRSSPLQLCQRTKTVRIHNKT